MGRLYLVVFQPGCDLDSELAMVKRLLRGECQECRLGVLSVHEILVIRPLLSTEALLIQ